MKSVEIRSDPGCLTSQDLCNACPDDCEFSAKQLIGQALDADLMVRRGWCVTLTSVHSVTLPLHAGQLPAHSDDWALFLGRLLLVDPDMRVTL